MDEGLDTLTTGEPPRPISHRDILVAMAVLIVVGAAAGFAFGGVGWGFGVIVGGILSYLNYLWLDRSTKAIFRRNAGSLPAFDDEPQTEGVRSEGPALLAIQYIARYIVMGAVLLLIYLTDAFPMAAVILGLAAFALAVVPQGVKNIFTS